MIAAIASAGCVAGFGPSQAAASAPMVCIADGTSADVVAARMAIAAQAEPQAANVTERWTRTATDGRGIVRGEPITVTWSVVPDGTKIDGTLGEPSAKSSLRAFLNENYESETVWIDLIQQALDGWSTGPGITFAYELKDDGIDLSGGRGKLGVRGDVRIGGHPIDGDLGTVAYAFFPNGGGDIVIDTRDSFNTTRARFRNVVSHEAGHAIGLGHTCPLDKTKLMEPTITTIFSGPQFDDLLGAHRNYGDLEEENDVAGEAANLGLAIDSTTIDNRLALDDNLDDDWFVVPAGALTEITVDLAPAGTTYPFGTLSEGTCPVGPLPDFDPTFIQDLAVAVVDFDGTTTIASADVSAAGGSESLADVRLSRFGGFIRVSGGGIDDAQAYELEVTLVPEPTRGLLRAAALLGLVALAKFKQPRA
ncbi:MAG: matrixin family metalloprotease [Deltaproteobacteria bacterium]|nr:matrixin family metalloprotease [Deltaproteobacteria bacterium]